MTVDLHQLMACTGARQDRAERAMQGINNAMAAYEIAATKNRIGMFLANVGHECGGFQWPEELWDGKRAQATYERDPAAHWGPDLKRGDRNFKAWTLGNLMAGDGKRFKGRCWLQITGRTNYRRLTQSLRARCIACPDFEVEPAKLALPEWAAIGAADYVDKCNLNAVADAGDFDKYCDLINLGRHTEDEGDSNGYVERARLWVAAQRVLA